MIEEYYDSYESQPKRRNGMLHRLVMVSSWIVTLLAVALGAAFLLIVETQRPGPPAADGAAQTVIVVPRGVGIGSIGDPLQASGVVRNSLVFRVGVMIYGRGRSLKAGEYSVPSGESMAGVIEKLSAGKVVLHPITAPEGWTSAMVVDMLAASDVLEGETPAPPPEGTLLPETYRVERGTERASVLRKMEQEQKDLLAKLWPARAPNLPFRTQREALVLASIVEKETGLDGERPRVAAVFVNRLRKGMRLESDPTVIYGVSQGRPLGRPILQSELSLKTPYNTYQIYGLPPGPIANPGKAALEAVLNPPSTGDLYFVADGTGGHVFAATLAEHQRNVTRWRALEKLRGAQWNPFADEGLAGGQRN